MSAGLTRGKLAALAAASAVSTGLVLGSASSGQDPMALIAAALGGPLPAGLAPAGAAAASPPPAAATPGGGLAPLPAFPRAAPPAATAQSNSPAAPGSASAVQSAPASSPAPAPAKTDGGPSAPAPPSTALIPSKVRHVFVIVLASPGYEPAFGANSVMPYLSGDLRPRGALLTNYRAVSQSDLPNYIAMVSGQPPNPSTESDCALYSEFPVGTTVGADGLVPGAGCVYPVETLTVADQTGSTRLSWRAYAEDMSNGTPPVKACRRPGPNGADPTQQGRPADGYAARHNPFVYFHSLLDLGDCTANDLPLDQLKADLAKEASTPNYAFIAPGLCHGGFEAPCADGATGGPAAADGFLREWVPKILDSPAYKRDGALVITFAHPPVEDDPVGALVLSRWATPGAASDAPYDHYSLLRSTEDLLGLQHLAKAADPTARGFARELLAGAF